MRYYQHATDIIGYAFCADIYCPHCIASALPTGADEPFDGWNLAEGAVPMSAEANLTEIASAFCINREDESTFDSSEFPKVIFRSDADGTEVCGKCGEELE